MAIFMKTVYDPVKFYRPHLRQEDNFLSIRSSRIDCLQQMIIALECITSEYIESNTLLTPN